MALVFQYGSNMLTSRLNGPSRLDGAAVPLALARTVESFDLAFTRMSTRQGYAVADLVPGSRQVYGVLYDIPDSRVYRNETSNVVTLDEIEGEGQAYRRKPIEVQRLDTGRVIESLTYFVIRRTQGLRTSPGYVEYIIAGLREHGAPADYLEYVKARAIRSVPDAATIIAGM